MFDFPYASVVESFHFPSVSIVCIKNWLTCSFVHLSLFFGSNYGFELVETIFEVEQILLQYLPVFNDRGRLRRTI